MQDVLFYRGLENLSGPFYNVGGQYDFYETFVSLNQVNIFFLAVYYRFFNVVDYILKDLKVVGSGRITRNVDPRIVISVAGDSTAVLRALIRNGDIDYFYRIWNDYGYLFDENDLLIVSKAFIWCDRSSFAQDFLQSSTTITIFYNAHQSVRQSFVNLISEKCECISINYYPYDLLERYTISEEYLPQLDRLIRDNEFDHLKNLLEGAQFPGISQIQFDLYPEDEEVLRLADDSTVTLSILNPILLAIKYKSFACLKYLVDRYGIRQTI